MPITGRGAVVQRVPHVRFVGQLTFAAELPKSSVIGPVALQQRPRAGRVSLPRFVPFVSVGLAHGLSVSTPRIRRPGRVLRLSMLAPTPAEPYPYGTLNSGIINSKRIVKSL